MTQIRHILFIGILLASCTPVTTNSHLATSVKVSVSLQKTMCFGTCPTYNFEVLSDGRATLTVGRFAEDVLGRALAHGNYSGTMDLTLIDHIVIKARDLNYFSLNEKYDDPMLMDLPATISTIEEHYVYNRYNGPDLEELYKLIERFIATVDWQPMPDSAP